MQIACGIDLVEYEAFGRYIGLGRERFVRRIYTPLEQVYCHNHIPCLAARFAMKEAVAKALGTGIRGVGLLEIETVNDETGRPNLRLAGRAAARAEQLQLKFWSISLSHAEHCAVAIAIGINKCTDADSGMNAVTNTKLKEALLQPNSFTALQELLDDLSQTKTIEGRT